MVEQMNCGFIILYLRATVGRRNANSIKVGMNYKSHQSCMKTLMPVGIDDLLFQNSATPLIMAAQNGHKEIVDELLKKKADVNAMNIMVS